MQGKAILYLSGPEKLAYNITLNRNFDPADQLQSVLLSVPQFINTSAVTLAVLYGANVTTPPQMVPLPLNLPSLPSQTEYCCFWSLMRANAGIFGLCGSCCQFSSKSLQLRI